MNKRDMLDKLSLDFRKKLYEEVEEVNVRGRVDEINYPFTEEYVVRIPSSPDTCRMKIVHEENKGTGYLYYNASLLGTFVFDPNDDGATKSAKIKDPVKTADALSELIAKFGKKK